MDDLTDEDFEADVPVNYEAGPNRTDEYNDQDGGTFNHSDDEQDQPDNYMGRQGRASNCDEESEPGVCKIVPNSIHLRN